MAAAALPQPVEDGAAVAPTDLVNVTGDGSDGGTLRCAACDNVPWAKLCHITWSMVNGNGTGTQAYLPETLKRYEPV